MGTSSSEVANLGRIREPGKLFRLLLGEPHLLQPVGQKLGQVVMMVPSLHSHPCSVMLQPLLSRNGIYFISP